MFTLYARARTANNANSELIAPIVLLKKQQQQLYKSIEHTHHQFFTIYNNDMNANIPPKIVLIVFCGYKRQFKECSASCVHACMP